MERYPGQRAGTSVYKYGKWFYHADCRAPGRRYVCADKTTAVKCRVKAYVHEDGSVEIVGGPHRHGASTYEKRKPLIQELKQLARGSFHSPHIILREVYERYKDYKKYMHRDTARQMIISERRKFLPPIPKTLREMADILKELDLAQPIYRGHFNTADQFYGLVFSTEKMMEALANNGSGIYIDGTFASRPAAPASCQLLVLHIRKRDVGIPVLFAICERRTKNFYIAFWTFLLEKIPSLIHNIQFVVSDFEAALIFGTRKMLPKIRIRGCWIHFIRATTRKWKNLNLPRCEETNNILGMIWSLALVPSYRFSEAINVIWAEIKNIDSNDGCNFQLFYEYLTRYWLPLAEVVSVWDCPVRTNNIAEAFNRHLPEKLGGERPKMYPFIEKLQGVLLDSEHLWEQLHEAGMVFNKGRRSFQLVKNQHIQHMQKSLIDNRFSMKDFLTGIFSYSQLNDDGVEALLCLDYYDTDMDFTIPVKYLQDPPSVPTAKLGHDYADWRGLAEVEHRIHRRNRASRHGHGRPRKQPPKRNDNSHHDEFSEPSDHGDDDNDSGNRENNHRMSNTTVLSPRVGHHRLSRCMEDLHNARNEEEEVTIPLPENHCETSEEEFIDIVALSDNDEDECC